MLHLVASVVKHDVWLTKLVYEALQEDRVCLISNPDTYLLVFERLAFRSDIDRDYFG